MTEKLLENNIEAYDQWKHRLITSIERFHQWLDARDMIESEDTLRFIEAADALKSDRLNIAFVAEFSRGKTELINALFFADFNRRLLPSDAGRTTMCPTELFYDRKANEAYVRLLPIETRLEDEMTIADFKLDPIQWTQINLDTTSPDQMEKAMYEVMQTKTVPVEKAIKLGLYSEEEAAQEDSPQFSMNTVENGQVEIPKWRHALISFPHPLLQQGLVILDTPGLNALGCEPELTLNMLPAAQAVVFILAADTGVTRSDLDVWQYHIEGFRRSKQNKGVAVVLNKIDTLWDGLKQERDIDNTIASQLQKTSLMLGIPSESIFTISAQKALFAKINNDDALLAKSQIKSLEKYLGEEILPSRETILRDNIVNEIGSMLDEIRSSTIAKITNANKQLKELKSLSGKNADMIVHLMKKTREEQTAYNKNVESFQSSRLLLKRQASKMLSALSIESLDTLTNSTRRAMTGSWTTIGLKKGMQTFFEGSHDIMNQVVEHAEQARRLVKAIYSKFHVEHGLPATEPKTFSLDRFKRRMDILGDESEAFRKSPVTTMTEQSYVIKKFFISLVSQARNVFFKANQSAEVWLREVMNPLVRQIKEHKSMMESRLKTLRKISESRDTLDAKTTALENEEKELQAQLKELNDIHEGLNQPSPFDAEEQSAA